MTDDGTLEEFGVELIGANRDAIMRAEDRELFRQTMSDAGIRIPWSITVESIGEALAELDEGRASLPAIACRPSADLAPNSDCADHRSARHWKSSWSKVSCGATWAKGLS